MRTMRAPLPTAIAIGIGLIILLGYFIPVSGILNDLLDVLLGWAVILAGTAGLVGIINLVKTHWRKMIVRGERDPYSPILILSFLATVAAGFMLGGPANLNFQSVVNAVQVPVETAMMAVLAISLGFAMVRLFGRRKGWMAIVFAISVVLYLILNSGFLAIETGAPEIKVILGGLQRLPVAGARGILLGIALGSLTTGLRILLGADRPYSG
jgi:hypothetical protein